MDWLRRVLPHAERAMGYITTHPWRWSGEHQLGKPPALTMDTWDFDYVSDRQPWLNFAIGEDTHWGIFHGDNSGYFEAFSLVARLRARRQRSRCRLAAARRGSPSSH